jgi:hypothetical protein
MTDSLLNFDFSSEKKQNKKFKNFENFALFINKSEEMECVIYDREMDDEKQTNQNILESEANSSRSPVNNIKSPSVVDLLSNIENTLISAQQTQNKIVDSKNISFSFENSSPESRPKSASLLRKPKFFAHTHTENISQLTEITSIYYSTSDKSVDTSNIPTNKNVRPKTSQGVIKSEIPSDFVVSPPSSNRSKPSSISNGAKENITSFKKLYVSPYSTLKSRETSPTVNNHDLDFSPNVVASEKVLISPKCRTDDYTSPGRIPKTGVDVIKLNQFKTLASPKPTGPFQVSGANSPSARRDTVEEYARHEGISIAAARRKIREQIKQEEMQKQQENEILLKKQMAKRNMAILEKKKQKEFEALIAKCPKEEKERLQQ